MLVEVVLTALWREKVMSLLGIPSFFWFLSLKTHLEIN